MSKESEYDIVVIGGGATGCGVAVDAASRGLKVALVEKYDFSSGTSSRSTKLIHGGVRYLQKAIMQLDREQVSFYLFYLITILIFDNLVSYGKRSFI
jgi:glycerol-3-phosphate dehydrogenase